MSKITDLLESWKIDPELHEFQVLVGQNVEIASPEIVAEMFAAMNSEQQADFFNHVHKVASQWHGGIGGLPMQLQYLTDTDNLTLGGRSVMSYIGDYSHWGLRWRG